MIIRQKLNSVCLLQIEKAKTGIEKGKREMRCSKQK